MYKKRNTDRFKKLYKPNYFIAHIAWYFINAAVFLTAVWYSPSNIMSTHPRRV